jgi:membrane protease YdiL (CAAX protease family)
MGIPSIVSMILKDKISLEETSILLGGFDFIIIIFCLLTSVKLFSNRDKNYINNNKLCFIKYYFLSSIYMIVGYILIKCVFISNINIYFISSANHLKNSIINTYINKGELVGVIVLFIQITMIGPIVEELLFRNILLRSLLDKYYNKPSKAIVYSSIVFAFIHFNLVQGIAAFGGGIILGLIFYYTKSIKLCIVAHILNNILVVMPMPLGIVMNLLYLVFGLYLLRKGIKNMRLKYTSRSEIII